MMFRKGEAYNQSVIRVVKGTHLPFMSDNIILALL